MMRVRIYIRIDPKGNTRLFVPGAGKCVDHIKLLNRLYIEAKNILTKRVINFPVCFAAAGKNYLSLLKTCFHRLLYLYSPHAISPESSFKHDLQQLVHNVCFQFILKAMTCERKGNSGL